MLSLGWGEAVSPDDCPDSKPGVSPPRTPRQGDVMRKPGRIATMGAVLVLAALASGVGGDDPLGVARPRPLPSAGISERTILTELQAAGSRSRSTPSSRPPLREAGASETLVVALRRAAPARRPGPPRPPRWSTAPRSARRAARRRRGRPRSHLHRRRPLVRVPVSVLDKKGQPVLGLRGTDFRFAEDGKRQEVTFFSGERRPLRLALALDVSASMKDKMRRGGGRAAPLHRPPRAGGRDHGHHLQQRRPRRPGLHVRPRASWRACSGGSSRRGHRALRRRLRGHPAGGPGARGEQGGGPGHRRRWTRPAGPPSTSCASWPGGRRCPSSRSGSSSEAIFRSTFDPIGGSACPAAAGKAAAAGSAAAAARLARRRRPARRPRGGRSGARTSTRGRCSTWPRRPAGGRRS